MSEPTANDATPLFEAARRGDSDSVVRLLEGIAPDVRARIASKIPDRFRSVLDVDDVMQITYMEVILEFHRFQSGGVAGFTAWVKRCAEHNLLDAIRALESAKRPDSRKRAQTPAGQESMVALVELLGATQSTPSRHAARDEGVRFLKAALGKLPADYLRVVTMLDLEGRPASEIATELGRSEGAIYMLRARAHDRLREHMGSESQFFSRHS